MALSQRASVAATRHFAACLEEARAFFVEQDEANAAERFRALRAELRKMTETLRWAPAGGRPARFFAERSVQARIRARKAQALADEAGLPHLREYVLKHHGVLYAHSSDRVVHLGDAAPEAVEPRGLRRILRGRRCRTYPPVVLKTQDGCGGACCIAPLLGPR